MSEVTTLTPQELKKGLKKNRENFEIGKSAHLTSTKITKKHGKRTKICKMHAKFVCKIKSSTAVKTLAQITSPTSLSEQHKNVNIYYGTLQMISLM